MPTKEHEALVELFRHKPSFAADLLAEAFVLAVPEFQRARPESIRAPDLALLSALAHAGHGGPALPGGTHEKQYLRVSE
jgi:hypothetical protein